MAQQVRIALRNCGKINPELIDDYIGADGYQALCKVVSEMTPDAVIDTMKTSGLRGRGGGGFPTGRKWEFAAAGEGQKYIICNADEGDPGAFMDRSILESDPHSVLEAMAIAGYAIGADTGLIYLRAEYPLAVKRVNIAIEKAKKYGILGNNIFGTDFSFDISIKLGAGAFVCGEETALIHSIEGYRGEPTTKPPFPAVEGLWGRPTIVNNVETYANIPYIFNKGADYFATIGTENSKGTKVFAIAGDVVKTGLVEVPMGTTLREVIYDIGGGILDGKAVKAVQTGGPSGGCIPADKLDTPIDYDQLAALGSMMGSGGMIVLDEDTCMVDTIRFYLDFTVDESCGKCTPCRIGNKRLLEMLDRIVSGTAEPSILRKMEQLAIITKDTSLCGLGQSSPNPVLSALQYFREEFEDHIFKKECNTFVCRSLLRYAINDRCVGCTQCAKYCPVHCITGEKKETHIIKQAACVKCGKCFEVCKLHAIDKETGVASE